MASRDCAKLIKGSKEEKELHEAPLDLESRRQLKEFREECDRKWDYGEERVLHTPFVDPRKQSDDHDPKDAA